MKFLKISLLLFIFVNTHANFIENNKKLFATQIVTKIIQNIKSEHKTDDLIQAIINKDIDKVKEYSKTQDLNGQPFICSLNNQDLKEIFSKLNLKKEEEEQVNSKLDSLEKMEFTNTYLSLALYDSSLNNTDKDKEISLSIVKELVNNGANINFYPEETNITNGLCCTIFIKKLPERLPVICQSQLKLYYPLIFCAIDSAEIIELLFDHGANPRVESISSVFSIPNETLLKVAEKENPKSKTIIEDRLIGTFNVDSKITEEAKKYIIERYNPLEIYIFGSFGLGNKEEAEYLNLLVITENEIHESKIRNGFCDLTDLYSRLSNRCRYVQLCIFSKKEFKELEDSKDNYYCRIKKLAKKIYSKK